MLPSSSTETRCRRSGTPATEISKTSPTSRRYSAAPLAGDHKMQADNTASVFNAPALIPHHRTPAIAALLRSVLIVCKNMMLYPLQRRNEETRSSCTGYGKYRDSVLIVSLASASCGHVLRTQRYDNVVMTRTLLVGTEKNAS